MASEPESIRPRMSLSAINTNPNLSIGAGPGVATGAAVERLDVDHTGSARVRTSDDRCGAGFRSAGPPGPAGEQTFAGQTPCRCSSMVERQLPKLNTRVRFPSSAPQRSGRAPIHTDRGPAADVVGLAD